MAEPGIVPPPLPPLPAANTLPGLTDPTALPPTAAPPTAPPPLEALVQGDDCRCPRCGARLLTPADPLCGRCGVDPRSPLARTLHAPRRGALFEALRGASYLPAALWTVARHPGLIHSLAVPLLLNVLIALGIAFLIVPALREWLPFLTMPDAFSTWTGWLKLPKFAFESLGWSFRLAPRLVVPGITAWIIAAPPFRYIFAAAGALISSAVERRVLGEPLEATRSQLVQREKVLASSVLSSIALTAFETAAYVVLLPIALLPLAGTFVWVMAPRTVFMGLDVSDPVLCRKVYSSVDKLRLWRQRRWRFLGLGAATLCLLCMPYVNGVALPLASIAATLLYLELDCK